MTTTPPTPLPLPRIRVLKILVFVFFYLLVYTFRIIFFILRIQSDLNHNPCPYADQGLIDIDYRLSKREDVFAHNLNILSVTKYTPLSVYESCNSSLLSLRVT